MNDDKRRLHLPNRLSKLNLDFSRLWLTRPLRRSSKAPQPAIEIEQPIVDAHLHQPPAEEPHRPRTPVFTRPPPGLVLKPSALPSPTFTFGKTPYRLACVAEVQAAKDKERLRVWDHVLQPIRVPQLLPLKLKLSLPGFDWNDQPPVVSPMKDMARLKAERTGRLTGEPSPLLPSSPNYSISSEEELPALFHGYAELEASEFSEDEFLGFFRDRRYAFEQEEPEDETYFGDEEDNGRKLMGNKVDGDCFAWLEDDLACLFIREAVQGTHQYSAQPLLAQHFSED
ncbi:hypothetical protein H0H87_009884 [Tephrocybe sp. NHM501043]|nr:hypothetical protein H0H87_009884 [Tephrocybe sp. NHM501043]